MYFSPEYNMACGEIKILKVEIDRLKGFIAKYQEVMRLNDSQIKKLQKALKDCLPLLEASNGEPWIKAKEKAKAALGLTAD